MAEELIICNTRNSNALHLPFCLTNVKQFSVFFIKDPNFTTLWLLRSLTRPPLPPLKKLDLKVTEQVRGCVAENHPHVHVILQKCLNLFIILKLTEPKMTWKCFLSGEIEYKMYCDQQMQNEANFINAANSCRIFVFRSKQWLHTT